MNVNLIMLAFALIIVLSTINPKYYFIVVAISLAIAALYKQRSGFADGDSADMALGDTVELSEAVDDASITADLDSSADIDDILSGNTQITNGDDLLSSQMQVVGSQAKQAILHRSRFTSDNFRQYYTEELDAAENRHWWEDDTLSGKTVKNEENWE